MSKDNDPQPANLDPCLEEEPTSKPRPIKSMVNAAYMRNLPIVRRNIEQGKSDSARAARDLSKLIIK